MKKIVLTASLQERYDTICSCSRGDITNKEAAYRLGLEIRQVQRLKRACEKDGEKGLVHGLKGTVAHNAVDKVTAKKIVDFLKEKKHRDFGPTFAQEKLVDIKRSRETIRSIMIKNNLWKVKTRRGPQIHRSWRERMSSCGELVQFDGSYHDWFENGKEKCLLGAIDDATSNIMKICFEDNEGVCAVFRFWRAYVEDYGRPIAIYLDKFSTYKVNHAEAVNNANFLTQFERAMKSLDIRIIFANSPEAKGRIERLWGTLQDRLVKDMRLADVRGRDEANKFLNIRYVKDHNRRFSVMPKNNIDAHRPLTDDMRSKLSSIFSRQYSRRVNNDYTIQWQTNWFQLAAAQQTTVYKGDIVTIEEHEDGAIHILKNNFLLEYTKLPLRPSPVRMKVTALTREKPKWVPPANHPWRRNF